MESSRRTAIFDLDGTLIPDTSAEKTFFFFLLRSGVLNFFDIIKMVNAIWSAKGDIHDMVHENKRYLRGKKVETFETIAHDYFEPRVKQMIFPKMHALIEQHRANGDLLLLLSGTLDVIAGCFVRFLQMDGYKAGTLEINNNKYTGRIRGILPYGMGKLEVLRSLREEFNFDWNKTTLYANRYSDRYVMNAVEIPVAVNPDKRLLNYAQKHNWGIIQSRSKMNPVTNGTFR